MLFNLLKRRLFRFDWCFPGCITVCTLDRMLVQQISQNRWNVNRHWEVDRRKIRRRGKKATQAKRLCFKWGQKERIDEMSQCHLDKQYFTSGQNKGTYWRQGSRCSRRVGSQAVQKAVLSSAVGGPVSSPSRQYSWGLGESWHNKTTTTGIPLSATSSRKQNIKKWMIISSCDFPQIRQTTHVPKDLTTTCFPDFRAKKKLSWKHFPGPSQTQHCDSSPSVCQTKRKLSQTKNIPSESTDGFDQRPIERKKILINKKDLSFSRF